MIQYVREVHLSAILNSKYEIWNQKIEFFKLLPIRNFKNNFSGSNSILTSSNSGNSKIHLLKINLQHFNKNLYK